jgi:hypothetical protein
MTEKTMPNRTLGLLMMLGLLVTSPTFAQNALPSSANCRSLTCDGGVSSSFDLCGDVTYSRTFYLQNLQAITPATTVQDYFVAGSSTTQGEYSGVLLWDLLNLVGIQVNPAVKNDLDRKYIVVTGTDCYQAVFAMGEIDPTLAGSDQVTVAYANG